MRLLTLFAVLLVGASVAPAAVAQAFPAPGTGVFTWERVGDRPLDATGFSFAPGGRLLAADDSVWAFEPDAPGLPSGRWSRALNRPGGVIDAVLALDPASDTLLIGHGNGALLSRSVDGSATWTIVNGDLSGTVVGGPETPDGFFVVPTGHAYAGRLLAGGVSIYSDDRGATWTEAPQGVPPNSRGFAHVFAALPSGRILMGSNTGLATSDDGGASYAVTPLWGPYWTDGLTALATPGSMQSGQPSCGLPGGALCDGAVAVGFSSQLPDIRAWRTADGGRTWSESVALPQPNDGVGVSLVAGVVPIGVGPDGLGRAVTVLGRGVVYATADGGQTWAVVGRMPVRLGGGSHYARLVRLGPDGHLWVSTTINGTEREWMYRSAEPAEAAFPVAGEALPEASSEVGVSVRPNPASGRVEVSVTGAASARVVVVDALGREVAVVLAGEASGGARSVVVDVSSWPAGVYVVRATAAGSGAGGRVASARLVVAR